MGQLNSLQSNSEFIYLVKTNNLGDTLWTRILGDTIHDWQGYAIEANDGDLYWHTVLMIVLLLKWIQVLLLDY